MPRKPAASASASGSWAGAPPACEDGFSFANGEFFADASGQNRHRRATPAEVKEHFKSGNDKDRPAHWFEAQLLHYGLPPSKTKSVARMRLFDAVNVGLKVPGHIAKLEGKLKREWTKSDKEAKKELTNAGGSKETTIAKKPATKASEKKPTTKSPAKKPAMKASEKKPATKPPTKSKTKPATKPKTETKTIKTETKTIKTETITIKTGTNKKTPAKKTDAKQTTAKAVVGSKRKAAASSSSAPKKPKTTTSQVTPRRDLFSTAARRGTFSQGPTRESPRGDYGGYDSDDYGRDSDDYGRNSDDSGRCSSGYDRDSNDYENDSGDSDRDSDDYDSDSDNYPRSSSNANNRAKPCPMNGFYSLSCPYVTEEWPHYGDEFELSLSYDGSFLWGRFDFGVIEGVLRIDSPPKRPTTRQVSFSWRGREAEGETFWDRQDGWIKFLPSGKVEGYIDYQSITFSGRRDAYDERDNAEPCVLVQEWEDYTEGNHEWERRARW